MTDWSSMKVVELRAVLSSRGLPTRGVKAELIQRLNEADADAAPAEGPATDDSPPVDETNRTADEVPMQEVAAPEAVTTEPLSVIDAVATVNEDATAESSLATLPIPVTTETVAASPEASDEAPLPTPVPSSDAAAEMQKRKRRSSTPPPSAKRARQEEERQAEQREDVVDFDTGDLSSSPHKRPQNGFATQDASTEITKSEANARNLGGFGADNARDLHGASRDEASAKQATVKESPVAPLPMSASEARVLSPDVREDETCANIVATEEPLRPAPAVSPSQEQSVPLDASTQDAIKERVAIGRPSGTPQTTIEPQQPQYEDSRTEVTQPAESLPKGDHKGGSVGDIPMPSIHPPTTSLYIRELMRPLRPEMVEQYIVKLITPPGSEPDANLIEESYLDTIRTHAFVQLASVEAAQRVRAALHNQVWPNERNRKPLWVDFVPPRQVKDFIEREETSPRGGRRWEVVYEQDGGSVVAIHREVGSDSKPFSKPPPTGPAAGPTYPGIEAAPKGPRGRGVRPPFETPGGPQSQQTNAHPRLFFTPLNEDVVQRRLENMRSFYSRAPPPDLGKDYHRFTFENSDSFVDRGREVFIGIRPPHRQKEHEERLHRERLGTAGTSSVTDSRRGDVRPPRPPVTDENRFSRYDGGRRPDRPPRNRGFRGDRGPGRFRGEDPYRYRPGY